MSRAVNWHLLAMSTGVPLLIAFAVALPLWRSGRIIVGNASGVLVVFVGCLFFGGAEYADALKFRYWCAETQTPCAPTGSGDFLRLATFGLIAIGQAALIFIASASWEHRAQRARYDPRWR